MSDMTPVTAITPLEAAMGNSWSLGVLRHATTQAAKLIMVSTDDILSHKRTKQIARARQAAMWQAHRRGVSQGDIARFFKRDHTTVIHAIKVSQARYNEWAAQSVTTTQMEVQ